MTTAFNGSPTHHPARHGGIIFKKKFFFIVMLLANSWHINPEHLIHVARTDALVTRHFETTNHYTMNGNTQDFDNCMMMCFKIAINKKSE
jgi:hypothetical protein